MSEFEYRIDLKLNRQEALKLTYATGEETPANHSGFRPPNEREKSWTGDLVRKRIIDLLYRGKAYQVEIEVGKISGKDDRAVAIAVPSTIKGVPLTAKRYIGVSNHVNETRAIQEAVRDCLIALTNEGELELLPDTSVESIVEGVVDSNES